MNFNMHYHAERGNESKAGFTMKDLKNMKVKRQNIRHTKNRLRILANIFLVAFVNLMISSCSLDYYEKNETEEMLTENTEWPYAINGVLNIIEAGDYDEGDYPRWIVGFLEITNSPDEILIEFKGNIAQKAKLPIDVLDSNIVFSVLINEPIYRHGAPYFIITQINKIERSNLE